MQNTNHVHFWTSDNSSIITALTIYFFGQQNATFGLISGQLMQDDLLKSGEKKPKQMQGNQIVFKYASCRGSWKSCQINKDHKQYLLNFKVTNAGRIIAESCHKRYAWYPRVASLSYVLIITCVVLSLGKVPYPLCAS